MFMESDATGVKTRTPKMVATGRSRSLPLPQNHLCSAAIPPAPLRQTLRPLSQPPKPAAPPAEPPAPATHLRLYERAVSVKFLKQFVAEHPEVLGMHTWEVVDKVVRPTTKEKCCRYCELPGVNPGVNPGCQPCARLPPPAPRPPPPPAAPDVDAFAPGQVDVFASHCWGARFRDLMSAICGACPGETYVWVDIFAVLQHMKDASKNSDELFPEEDLRFDTVVQQCRAVLLVCNPSAEVSIVTEESIVRQEASVDVIISLPPQRVWCCFEILHAVLNKKPIVMQAGRAHEVAAAEQVPPFAATDRRTVLNMLQLIDMGKAQASFK